MANAATGQGSTPPSLGERLAGIRRRRFVDRLAERDLFRALLERFLEGVSSPAHRLALDACAFPAPI